MARKRPELHECGEFIPPPPDLRRVVVRPLWTPLMEAETKGLAKGLNQGRHQGLSLAFHRIAGALQDPDIPPGAIDVLNRVLDGLREDAELLESVTAATCGGF